MSDYNTKLWLEKCRLGDPTKQVEAIQQLLNQKVRGAVPTLIDTLKTTDSMVRCSVAEALGHLGVEEFEQAGAALMALLNDPEVIVRAEAVDALGVLGYVPAVGAIRVLLSNELEPLVRASAAETLGDFGDASALPELELAICDPDAAVRSYAANSIGLLGIPSILSKLVDYAENEQSPQVQAEINGACYRLGSVKHLDALLNLLEIDNEEAAANILNILNDLSKRKLPPTLATDAERIQVAVQICAQRIPLLKSDADQVLDNLTKL